MLEFRRARNFERTSRHVREITKKDRRTKPIVSLIRFPGITLRLLAVHLHCFEQTTSLNTPKSFPSRLPKSVHRLAWCLRPRLSAHKSGVVIGCILRCIIRWPLLLVHEDTREKNSFPLSRQSEKTVYDFSHFLALCLPHELLNKHRGSQFG